MPADLDRRAALRLFGTAGAVAFAAVAASTTAGCGTDADDEPEPVDPLIAQAAAARADAAAALAAIAVNPDHGGALQVVADQRTLHADALDAEVARTAGTYADGSTPAVPSASSATVTTSPAPVPALPLPQLRDRIAASQASAAGLARTLSDHRAGMLGSISAACATYVGVLLV